MIVALLLLLAMFSVSYVSAAESSDADGSYVVKVTHDEIKRGNNVNFTIDVKEKDGKVASNVYTYAIIKPANDPDTSYNALERSGRTDSNGKFKFNWNINPNQFLDKYVVIVTAGTGDNKTTYKYNFDLSATPTLDIKLSKKNIYEGENTNILVYLKIDGNDVGKFGNVILVCNNKLYGMNYDDKKRCYFINYNSLILGKNSLDIVYVPLNAPGFDNIPSIREKISVNVIGTPDLVISKIKRSGNNYKVTIKNIGKGKSEASKLKLSYKKKYRTVKVKEINAGKTKTVTVKFFKYNLHKKNKKYAHINYNGKSYEGNYSNNKVAFKSDLYYGLLPDLAITKVSRSGNNYFLTVKNIGNESSSGFKILMWYGSKKKGKGYAEFNSNKFGQFGNKLPPGVSATLSLPYLDYKTNSKFYKYILVNYDKKVPESNYKNNLIRIKI